MRPNESTWKPNVQFTAAVPKDDSKKLDYEAGLAEINHALELFRTADKGRQGSFVGSLKMKKVPFKGTTISIRFKTRSVAAKKLTYEDKRFTPVRPKDWDKD